MGFGVFMYNTEDMHAQKVSSFNVTMMDLGRIWSTLLFLQDIILYHDYH